MDEVGRDSILYGSYGLEKNKLSTARDMYCSFLGLQEMPKTAEGLPSELSLPPEALGHMEASLLQTLNDGRERGQNIRWNAATGYRESKIVIGNKQSIQNESVLPGIYNLFFGEKCLLNYHTHPKTGRMHQYEPSARDISFVGSRPRESYISLIGAADGVAALVQTEESAKIPISAIKLMREIDTRMEHTRFEDLSLHFKALNLKQLGLGFYVWETPSAWFERGNLQNGITLKKVT